MHHQKICVKEKAILHIVHQVIKWKLEKVYAMCVMFVDKVDQICQISKPNVANNVILTFAQIVQSK